MYEIDNIYLQRSQIKNNDTEVMIQRWKANRYTMTNIYAFLPLKEQQFHHRLKKRTSLGRNP